MRKLIIGILAILSSSVHAQVVINEIMQSNIDCIMDDLNEFPDSWVEIYNGTDAVVYLDSYKIGLEDNPSTAYAIPRIAIQPGKCTLIYCDKEGFGRHTNFRLDSGKGGSIYLFKNNVVVDKLEKIAKQPAPNISYGRKTDGADEWGYQQIPTPGSANCKKLCKKVLDAPVFSQPGFVYQSAQTITLELSLPETAPEGTIIRYTTDGSEPTRSNGYTYNPDSPIIIKNATRTVRATLFCDGYLSPRSTVHSYIFLNRAQTLPVVSIVTDNKYLYDSKIGIYTEGNYSSEKKNYTYDWRRPMNIEFFETDGTTCPVNQLGEFRIQGAATRTCSLKSLALYANKRFGEKRFSHEFFPEQRPGQKNFKSLLLRNAGNDFDYLYMRDAIIQSTMAANADIDYQAYRPAIIYINGIYKGIENIRERSNEDNIYTNYDELEDIDMVENSNELKAGTWDNFNAFKAFYTEHGHTMAEYAQWLDIEEFINVYTLNIFFNNQDWPGNNVVWWRPLDGVWRILVKDTDFGLGLYGSPSDFNTIAWLYDPNYDPNRTWANNYDHTRLFRRITEDPDFLREFIDRFAIYMGDFLNESGCRAVWDPMYETIKTEYPIHRKLYNEWWPNYNNELSTARNWLKARPAEVYKHLKDQYKLGNIIKLQLINPGIPSAEVPLYNVTVNGVKLTGNTLNGSFFGNRDLNISYTAYTAEELAAMGIESEVADKEVTGWEVIVSGKTTEYQGSTLSIKSPNTGTLAIKPVFTEVSGINEITGNSAVSTPAVYDIHGRMVQDTTAPGIYLQRMSNGKTRKFIVK